jgi:hypothetical protein
MQRFYENYFGKDDRPMSKAQALREAKLWLRSYEDDDGETPYSHPTYWSVFILVGDRGQLSVTGYSRRLHQTMFTNCERWVGSELRFARRRLHRSSCLLI